MSQPPPPAASVSANCLGSHLPVRQRGPNPPPQRSLTPPPAPLPAGHQHRNGRPHHSQGSIQPGCTCGYCVRRHPMGRGGGAWSAGGWTGSARLPTLPWLSTPTPAHRWGWEWPRWRRSGWRRRHRGFSASVAATFAGAMVPARPSRFAKGDARDNAQGVGGTPRAAAKERARLPPPVPAPEGEASPSPSRTARAASATSVVVAMAAAGGGGNSRSAAAGLQHQRQEQRR